jgi:hypothetical protein
MRGWWQRENRLLRARVVDTLAAAGIEAQQRPYLRSEKITVGSDPFISIERMSSAPERWTCVSGSG